MNCGHVSFLHGRKACDKRRTISNYWGILSYLPCQLHIRLFPELLHNRAKDARAVRNTERRIADPASHMCDAKRCELLRAIKSTVQGH